MDIPENKTEFSLFHNLKDKEKMMLSGLKEGSCIADFTEIGEFIELYFVISLQSGRCTICHACHAHKQ